jgi:hypothetical protein
MPSTPEQLKRPYALWTRTAVAQPIEQRFGIVLAVRTMGLYLKRWGLTRQKPIKKAYEQSPATVKRWLQQDSPAIAARAKAKGAETHWGDESGLRSDDGRGRSDAPQGQPRKVFLILDKLRVHHAKPVKAWLAEHKDLIEVHYLPSYSPELNPDELANADQAATGQGHRPTPAQRAETARQNPKLLPA